MKSLALKSINKDHKFEVNGKKGSDFQVPNNHLDLMSDGRDQSMNLMKGKDFWPFTKDENERLRSVLF